MLDLPAFSKMLHVVVSTGAVTRGWQAMAVLLLGDGYCCLQMLWVGRSASIMGGGAEHALSLALLYGVVWQGDCGAKNRVMMVVAPLLAARTAAHATAC